MRSPIADDLRKNLSARIDLLVADTFDTCKRAGISPDESVAVVFVAVVHSAVMISHATGLAEEDFTDAVRHHFREMGKSLEKRMGERSR